MCGWREGEVTIACFCNAVNITYIITSTPLLTCLLTYLLCIYVYVSICMLGRNEGGMETEGGKQVILPISRYGPYILYICYLIRLGGIVVGEG